jgi:hypothetical protein
MCPLLFSISLFAGLLACRLHPFFLHPFFLHCLLPSALIVELLLGVAAAMHQLTRRRSSLSSVGSYGGDAQVVTALSGTGGLALSGGRIP